MYFLLSAGCIFLVGLILEDPTGITYRYRSLGVFGYALWLLLASTLLGLLRTLVWLRLLPALPDWTPWRQRVRSTCDYDAEDDFALLFGSEHELQLLKERLAKATSQAEDREQQCQLLESRLTHEQLRANRSDAQAKQLLRRRAHSSLLGVGLDLTTRKTRVQYMQDALLSFHFLWRLSRALGQKLTYATVKATHLEGGLRTSVDACNNLRVDKNILKSATDGLREQLSLAQVEKLELSKKLLTVHVHYTRSLRAREKAAEAWIAFRQKSASQHAEASRSLFIMTMILWCRARFLTQHLSQTMHKTTLMKAELAVARTKYNNVSARYDTLMSDCDASYEKISKLEDQLHMQADEIAELHISLADIKVERDKAVCEQEETRAKLTGVYEDYDDLYLDHTSLKNKHATLERRLSRVEAQCAVLEQENDEHIRASGLTIALFAHHIDDERKQAEAEKVAGFQPVQDMVEDLRSRLAVADDYVKMMSKPSPAGPRRSLDRTVPRLRFEMLPSPPDSAAPSPVSVSSTAQAGPSGQSTPTRSVLSVLPNKMVPRFSTTASATRLSLDPADRRPLFVQIPTDTP